MNLYEFDDPRKKHSPQYSRFLRCGKCGKQIVDICRDCIKSNKKGIVALRKIVLEEFKNREADRRINLGDDKYIKAKGRNYLESLPCIACKDNTSTSYTGTCKECSARLKDVIENEAQRRFNS